MNGGMCRTADPLTFDPSSIIMNPALKPGSISSPFRDNRKPFIFQRVKRRIRNRSYSSVSEVSKMWTAFFFFATLVTKDGMPPQFHIPERWEVRIYLVM